jgi:hypothetical protein
VGKIALNEVMDCYFLEAVIGMVQNIQYLPGKIKE